MSNALINIVDDDPIYGTTLHKILNVKKYTNVKLYSSGEECLENLNNKPALIILDFSMERLNGLDVLKLIKTKQPKAKVVFLTSLNKDEKLITTCKAAGALGFFQKDEKGIEELIDWIGKNLKGGVLSIFK